MELDTKLYLVGSDGEKFMGIGVLWLLENIGEEQSLRAASMKMNLSYSKAYNMLRKLEKEVGRPFVERKRGGASREGVVLTPFARRYMDLYRNFQEKAKKAASVEYNKYRKELDLLLKEEENDEKDIQH